MLFDPRYWIIVGPTILLALLAQMMVKSAFAKYSQKRNYSGMTGAQAARHMLEAAGLRVVGSAEAAKNAAKTVAIEQVQGFLSDHYDPQSRVLRLSPKVYGGNSIASVGVACHEAGHALQHAGGYAPLAIRSVMVPVASFGSWMAFPLIFLGLFMGAIGLVKVGILLFTAIVAFQIVTLPVEFNASSRAKAALRNTGIIQTQEETDGVNSVLNAAAMTYVAAAVSSIATLLYYLLLVSGGGRD